MSIDLITRFDLKPATLQYTAANLCRLITLHTCVSLSNWGVGPDGHLPGTNYSCVQLQRRPRRSPVNSQARAW